MVSRMDRLETAVESNKKKMQSFPVQKGRQKRLILYIDFSRLFSQRLTVDCLRNLPLNILRNLDSLALLELLHHVFDPLTVPARGQVEHPLNVVGNLADMYKFDRKIF